MLYPKEHTYDENHRMPKLVYECRICGEIQQAREGDEWDHCVYKSDFNQRDANSLSSTFTVDKDIIKDPTL